MVGNILTHDLRHFSLAKSLLNTDTDQNINEQSGISGQVFLRICYGERPKTVYLVKILTNSYSIQASLLSESELIS